jgi:GTPase involved in cell partitioning and DNA repair
VDTHIIDTENIRASLANDLNNIVQELEDINEKLQDIEREIDNLV